MKSTIVIASLLGVFLASALAGKNQDGKRLHHDVNSHDSFIVTGLNSNSMGGFQDWKSVWDVTTGYVATKVFSKNTCIISRLNGMLYVRFPSWRGPYLGPGPVSLPSKENRYVISRNRLQSLSPYGRRIQALCRGVPSYFAYPAIGSNFIAENISCLKVKINEQPVYYCG